MPTFSYSIRSNRAQARSGTSSLVAILYMNNDLCDQVKLWVSENCSIVFSFALCEQVRSVLKEHKSSGHFTL